MSDTKPTPYTPEEFKYPHDEATDQPRIRATVEALTLVTSQFETAKEALAVVVKERDELQQAANLLKAVAERAGKERDEWKARAEKAEADLLREVGANGAARADVDAEKARADTLEEAMPKCAICAKPATCFGSYEDNASHGFACDECCGHGNEDGQCSRDFSEIGKHMNHEILRADRAEDALVTEAQKASLAEEAALATAPASSEKPKVPQCGKRASIPGWGPCIAATEHGGGCSHLHLRAGADHVLNSENEPTQKPSPREVALVEQLNRAAAGAMNVMRLYPRGSVESKDLSAFVATCLSEPGPAPVLFDRGAVRRMMDRLIDSRKGSKWANPELIIDEEAARGKA